MVWTPSSAAKPQRLAAVLALAALMLQACALPAQIGAQTGAPQRSRELLTHGDAKIDVIVDGRGPAIVLLPSSRRDSTDFDELAQLIAAQGFRVLRPQPRGMGGSTGPLDTLSLTALAQDVAVTVEQLGGGRAVLVGHAYGHFIARVADLNHPQLVRGVVVAAGAARTFPPGMSASLEIIVDTKRPDAERLEHLKRAFFAPGSDASVWLSGWYPQLTAAYRQAAASPPRESWFGKANAPILDLQAANDPWRPPSSRNELKDLLGDKVTVQVIANAGHALIPEQPQAVADAIVAWVRGLKP